MSRPPNTEFIPTRESLLSRLRSWDDHESWRVFFDTYWRLIYATATKSGLSEHEAQEVVQETVISVMKSMPGFQYDKKNGSFKAWLMKLTSWRITDQLRKRRSQEVALEEEPAAGGGSLAEVLADPSSHVLEAIWEEEWENNLMEAAMERVKQRVDGKCYQIFDLYVRKQWPVKKVAETMKVKASQVYLAKHRVTAEIKKQVAKLKAQPI